MNVASLVNRLEKGHYPFKRYPKVCCETVLFPGCAFPSQFPRTMDVLAGLCRAHGIGIAYDCCGHPLDGFGVEGGTDRVLGGVERRLRRIGCKRVVTVCPNCLMAFRGRSGIPALSVFELFGELGVPARGAFAPGVLFLPCPDKPARHSERKIRELYDLSAVPSLEGVGCCGLLPEIARRGPEATAACTRQVLGAAGERAIYAYCASCAGQFARMGHTACRHVVSVVLGVDEEPDAEHALLNRARRKLDRQVDPCLPASLPKGRDNVVLPGTAPEDIEREVRKDPRQGEGMKRTTMSRRSFATMMGIAAVTAAGAGLGLTGCGNSSTSSSASSAASVAATASVASSEQRTVFVTPDWLNGALAGQRPGYENILVGYVTYSDDGSDYSKGHIPGAINVYDVDVEDADGTKERPYNLLPADELEKNLLAQGITKDTKVVLYGADICGTARVALGLLYAGVEDVKILNGGFTAWKNAGYDTETTENKPVAATDFGATVPAHPEYVLSMEDAISKLDSDDNFKLVSIRAEDEWLGKTSGYSYIDRAGEPEGAVWGKGPKTSADIAQFMNDDGTLKTLDELKEIWQDCDFTLDNELSFYCGTGWRACPPFLRLYEAGYTTMTVYDGGWYEWQMYPENKVQVGDPASSDCKHVTVADLPTNKAAKS